MFQVFILYIFKEMATHPSIHLSVGKARRGYLSICIHPRLSELPLCKYFTRGQPVFGVVRYR